MYITHLLITKSSVKRATFFAPVIVIHIEKNLDIKEALYKICFIEFPLYWCNLLRMDLYVSYSLFVRLSLRASDDENVFAILKWEGNWGELTFAKTSGIVTADGGKTELDNSWPVRSQEQLGAHFGSRSLLVSKVANGLFTYVIPETALSPPKYYGALLLFCISGVSSLGFKAIWFALYSPVKSFGWYSLLVFREKRFFKNSRKSFIWAK